MIILMFLRKRLNVMVNNKMMINELTEEHKKEAIRLFELRRRIYDSANIKDKYTNHREYEFSWFSSDELDITDLSNQDIFALTVIVYSLRDYGVPSRAFMEAYSWNKNKVYKLAKNEDSIYSTTLFCEDTSLIAGKGYVIYAPIRREMERLYSEFLWHDSLDEMPERVSVLLLDIDNPEIFVGTAKGIPNKTRESFQIMKPEYIRDKDIPNWPMDGYFKKNTIDVDRSCVKRWKILY